MVTIYALYCLETQFAYVGSTKAKTSKRLREHRCTLRSGSHGVAALQIDWNIYGEAAFRMVCLDDLPDGTSLDGRRKAELKWMEHFAKDGKLYNEHRISMRPTNEAIRKGVANAHLTPGNRWTPEANERRRKAQLGIPKGHGAKISATKRAKREQVMR
jgi:hypothetical protein